MKNLTKSDKSKISGKAAGRYSDMEEAAFAKNHVIIEAIERFGLRAVKADQKENS
jgi:hypothetical protein